jgi:hypothetical protein
MSSEFEVPVEVAMGMLNVQGEGDDQTVHAFLNPGWGLIGADWSLAEVQKCMAKSQPQLAGPSATSMGHGIVCPEGDDSGGPVFFETKKGEAA